MIELQAVTKCYRGCRTVGLLCGIDLRVAGGEVVFISGPTGGGKTTLLRLIYAAETADSGVVKVFAHDVQRLRRSSIALLRRRVGIVPQEHDLLADRSALENVMLPLETTALPRRQVRASAAALLEQLDLNDLADTPAGELSGGEKSGIALARALVTRPAILLLDEPSAHWDLEGGERVLSVLEQQRRQGAAVVAVTNDRQLLLGAALRAFRHLELAAGRLAAADPYDFVLLQGAAAAANGSGAAMAGNAEAPQPRPKGDSPSDAMAADRDAGGAPNVVPFPVGLRMGWGDRTGL